MCGSRDYAMISQRYRGQRGQAPAGFSLHAVVRTGAQRRGWFRTLAPEVYDQASGFGWQFATGVCNDKSIGTVVKYLGWKTPGPLPVRLCVPVPRRGRVESRTVDRELLASPTFEELTAGLDVAPVHAWTNSYTTEYLRWRLSCPHATYALHWSHDQLAISTTDRRFGVRAAVLLKLLPRGVPTGPLRADPMVTAACLHHRAPFAAYAGFNAHVRVRGVAPPRRFQPSPLHLILRSLSDEIDQETLAVDTFEFLDMDAY